MIRDILAETRSEKDISLDWVKNKYHLIFRMVQIIHTSTGKHLDEISTTDFTKAVGAMRGAQYSDNYRRQLVSVLKGVSLYLAEHGHDIAPDTVNKGRTVSAESRERMCVAQRKRFGLDDKENPRVKSTCDIITEHHNTMKEDPEHLSTDFIQKLIGKIVQEDCMSRIETVAKSKGLC